MECDSQRRTDSGARGLSPRPTDSGVAEHLAQLDAELKTKLNSLRITSELESFRIDIVAETGKPWGIAALPDGRLLVTEEAGALRVIDHGHLLPNPVEGTPRGVRPTDHFQRTLLDVAVHPDHQRNRWIYLLRHSKSTS